MTLHGGKAPMQVDGEPWEQPPAIITLRAHNQATMLANIDWSLALGQRYDQATVLANIDWSLGQRYDQGTRLYDEKHKLNYTCTDKYQTLCSVITSVFAKTFGDSETLNLFNVKLKTYISNSGDLSSLCLGSENRIESWTQIHAKDFFTVRPLCSPALTDLSHG